MKRLEIGHGTHIGLVRELNEDSYVVGDHFVVVADGMGGHNKGEVASALAADVINEQLKKAKIKKHPESDYLLILEDAIEEANYKVYKHSLKDTGTVGMGTTVVAAIWSDKMMVIANVGDSRCYRIRDGGIEQITVDHTLVQHWVEEGKISKEEAAVHKSRNIITRAVGTEESVRCDIVESEINENDIWLFCSDGLSSYLSNDIIKNELLHCASVQAAVDGLIAKANAAGGMDNITVVAVKF